MTRDQAILSAAIDHLMAQGVFLDISGPSENLRYEIAGQAFTESDLIAKAFALGMASFDRASFATTATAEEAKGL